MYSYVYLNLTVKKVQTVQTYFKKNSKLNLKLYSSVFHACKHFKDSSWIF